MALKYIPQSWKDNLAGPSANFAHDFNFYINPRCRVIPALTSAGVSYIKNDAATNMRGTYRMQCGASTDLTYLYTLPQRFIIEGWFKPEFAYDVAANQDIIASGPATTTCSIVYSYGSDVLVFQFLIGATVNSFITSPVFSTTPQLQKWIYVRAYLDNLAKLSGFYCTVNGVVYADSQAVPNAGAFVPMNTISFMPTVAAESSYWIIHELDETLATGEYKTYQADRQIIFEFNGTTLARERIRIPRNSASTDLRGVKSFNTHSSVENMLSGSACANTAGLTLYNCKGQFSDDQYDAFDPFQGYYNGTQKYLQNRVGVEIETESPANTVRDGLLLHCSFDSASVATAADNSGNGLAGTITDCTVVTGKSSYGIQGNGTSGKVVFGDVCKQTGAISISIWAKLITTVAGAGLIGKYLTAGNLRGYLLDIYSSNYPRFLISEDGISFIEVQHSVALSNSEFEHIVAVFIPSTSITIYRGGIQVAQNTESIPASIFDSSTDLEMLRGATHTVYANVAIDEARIYNRALSLSEIEWLYEHPSDWGTISKVEPAFIGRTTPGAFKRNSPNHIYGDVTIEAEDGISELGETKLTAAHAFEDYDICDPAAESDSLVHSIARLVTKKEIRNYALNSSIENATIGNSWLNTGMATFERSNTYAQFGTYSMKCIADAAGDMVTQVIKFETNDLIDVGDTFNFSAFIRQGTASTVKIIIEELNSAGALVGTGSETACGTDIDVFTRVNVSRTILAATCTQLRITVYALDVCTFYVDGIMLTRGIDPIDYFLVNANDGASGIGSAEDAETIEYDSVGFDCDAVDIEHPYAIVKKGETVWSHLKKIGDASLCYYLGMSPDGVFCFKNRYAEAGTSTPENICDVEHFGAIATSLDVPSYNAVKVTGYTIDEGSKTTLWSAENAAGFTLDSGGKPKHPVANNDYLYVGGCKLIEATYAEKSDE